MSTLSSARRAEVDDINEKFGLHLPTSDDYDTLAGLILSEKQSIPAQGDVITIEGYEMKIIHTGHATIDKVQLSVL